METTYELGLVISTVALIEEEHDRIEESAYLTEIEKILDLGW